MQDTALYQYLLGLNSPWTVSRVQLNVKGQCVDVWAEHPEGALWACPKCAQEFPLYDHAEERTWRHLDSCQYQTYLHARIPRVACGEHGVVQVKVPWAEAPYKLTAKPVLSESKGRQGRQENQINNRTAETPRESKNIGCDIDRATN